MSYKKFILIFMTTAVVMVSMQPILFFGSMGILNEQTQYSNGWETYLNDWITYKQNIAAEIVSPKVVLLSGSNSLFGLSAEMMEQELGIPVINLGTHAGFCEYIFYKFKGQIKSKDIVILPLEYNYYQNSSTFSKEIWLYIFRYDKEYFRNYFEELPMRLKIKLIYTFDLYDLFRDVKLKLSYKIDEKSSIMEASSPYYVGNFNKHGDTTTNVTNRIKKPEIYENVFGNDVPNEKPKTELHQFIQWCRENDIKVYFAWPSYLIKGQAFNKHDAAQIRKIEQFMADENVEILGNYKDNLFEVKYFYDTTYHLNTEGKAIRTRILLDEIKNNVQLKEYIDSIKQ